MARNPFNFRSGRVAHPRLRPSHRLISSARKHIAPEFTQASEKLGGVPQPFVFQKGARGNVAFRRRRRSLRIPTPQLPGKPRRIPLGAIGNCRIEIGDEKERCVAPTALGSLCFPFPALPGGANLCRASRADCRRGRLSMKNRG
jgi:hypothetical protein